MVERRKSEIFKTELIYKILKWQIILHKKNFNPKSRIGDIIKKKSEKDIEGFERILATSRDIERLRGHRGTKEDIGGIKMTSRDRLGYRGIGFERF